MVTDSAVEGDSGLGSQIAWQSPLFVGRFCDGTAVAPLTSCWEGTLRHSRGVVPLSGGSDASESRPVDPPEDLSEQDVESADLRHP